MLWHWLWRALCCCVGDHGKSVGDFHGHGNSTVVEIWWAERGWHANIFILMWIWSQFVHFYKQNIPYRFGCAFAFGLGVTVALETAFLFLSRWHVSRWHTWRLKTIAGKCTADSQAEGGKCNYISTAFSYKHSPQTFESVNWNSTLCPWTIK